MWYLQAALTAGFPKNVPCHTVTMACISSNQAITSCKSRLFLESGRLILRFWFGNTLGHWFWKIAINTSTRISLFQAWAYWLLAAATSPLLAEWNLWAMYQFVTTAKFVNQCCHWTKPRAWARNWEDSRNTLWQIHLCRRYEVCM